MKRNVLIACITLFILPYSAHAYTHYVDVNSATPTYPYLTWEMAAATIQDAVNAAGNGDVILVLEGTYKITSEILIGKAITLRSVNGPEVTIIDGQQSTRCLNVTTSSLVSGFTITGGANGSGYGARGGGIYCENSATVVSNCVISGNKAEAGAGGGMYGGTARNCVFSNNFCNYGEGGGMSGGDARDCVFDRNWAFNGGGMLGGAANNCMFSGNVARFGGGGMSGGTARNCVFSNNFCNYGEGGGMSGGDARDCIFDGNGAYRAGGGMYGGIASNCTFSGNSSRFGGGGMYGGTANNCTFSSNGSEFGGGGMRDGEANNCTFSGNSGGYGCGGMSGGTANNCILWYNTTDNLSGTAAHNCCSPDVVHGVDGNITNAPKFLDPDNGNYRLLATSPCIDAGSNALVVTSTDIDGSPRIIDGDFDGVATVDMGAYEFNARFVDILVSTINLKSKGRTPVAVLTTDDFDAATIYPESVRFAGAKPVHYALEDVDRDGDIDLKLHFMTANLDIDPADGDVALVGQTYDGILVAGVDTVRIVP